MSLLLSASRLRGLERAEQRLGRPLTTVRRIAVAALAPFPTEALARLLARTTARHRPGRVLLASQEWARYSEVPEDRRDVPPELDGLLRTHGAAWVGDPSLDDRFFELAFSDAGVIGADDLVGLARARAAVCLVVPVERAAAEPAVAVAEQLTREGRRVVLALDRTRPGRGSWAIAVAGRLASPAVELRADPALTRPGRPPARRTLLAAAELAGHLLTDPGDPS